MTDQERRKLIEAIPDSVRQSFAQMSPLDYNMGEQPDRVSFALSVSRKGWGFGEFTFVTNKQGLIVNPSEMK